MAQTVHYQTREGVKLTLAYIYCALCRREFRTADAAETKDGYLICPACTKGV